MLLKDTSHEIDDYPWDKNPKPAFRPRERVNKICRDRKEERD